MSNVGKIRLRNLAELQSTSETNIVVDCRALAGSIVDATPEKKSAGTGRAATTTRKERKKDVPHGEIIASTTVKRSSKNTPLPGQMRIDSFFKSAAKTYKVEGMPKSSAKAENPTLSKRKGPKSGRGRKRLFSESATTSSSSSFYSSGEQKPVEKRVLPDRMAKGKENLAEVDVVDLCSEDDEMTIKEVSLEDETPKRVQATVESNPVKTSGAAKAETPASVSMLAKESPIGSRYAKIKRCVNAKKPVKTTAKPKAKSQKAKEITLQEKPSEAVLQSPESAQTKVEANSVRTRSAACEKGTPTATPMVTIPKESPIGNRSIKEPAEDALQSQKKAKAPARGRPLLKRSAKSKPESPPPKTVVIAPKESPISDRSTKKPLKIALLTPQEIVETSKRAAMPIPSNNRLTVNKVFLEKMLRTDEWVQEVVDSLKGTGNTTAGDFPSPRNRYIVASPSSSKTASEVSSPSSISCVSSNNPSPAKTGRKPRKHKPCPPYKVVEGTSFCVDGFQFGYIPGVTHYFLTHYHADHYIGLTKNFSYPLYMSPITARMVRLFKGIDDVFIREIDVDQTIRVDDVEVTAIEANHCPGAVMFYFKLSSGEHILHTGDFRACAEMESLPIFWNHANIDLLYLDTTYLDKNYDFCHQSETVDRVLQLVHDFKARHRFKSILIVCGSYVIGKEKIWMAIAEEFGLRVWTEATRSTAISCMGRMDMEYILTDDPSAADLHVIPMLKVNYPGLVEYFRQYEDKYDMVLGIRPSGWEKKNKPSYGKKISIIGLEYSEHSSYKELERFVRFLKPKRVISTVPAGRDLAVTKEVPKNWYQYSGPACMLSTGYQPSISTFLSNNKVVVPQKKPENNMSLSPMKKECFGYDEEDRKTIVPLDFETSRSSNPLNQDAVIVIPSESPNTQAICSEIKKEGEDSRSRKTSAAEVARRLTSDASDDWLSCT